MSDVNDKEAKFLYYAIFYKYGIPGGEHSGF